MLTTKVRARGLLCTWLVLFPAASLPAQQPGDKTQAVLRVFGRITTLDPIDNVHKRGRAKVHSCVLTADTTYAIDLVTDRPHSGGLRVEDSDGKLLGETFRFDGSNRITVVPARTGPCS